MNKARQRYDTRAIVVMGRRHGNHGTQADGRSSGQLLEGAMQARVARVARAVGAAWVDNAPRRPLPQDPHPGPAPMAMAL